MRLWVLVGRLILVAFGLFLCAVMFDALATSGPNPPIHPLATVLHRLDSAETNVLTQVAAWPGPIATIVLLVASLFAIIASFAFSTFTEVVRR